MQFGFFDDANKEYVIERPDTPKSWSNYLGSTEYGAIMSISTKLSRNIWRAPSTKN